MLKWLVTSLVLYFAVKWVRTTIERGARRSLEARSQPKRRVTASREEPPSKKPAPKSRERLPHEILGVEPDAPTEVVQARYRKLAAQYHPDKLASSAAELQELAGQRLREINAAYAEIMKARAER